jgi:hypothetical protein
LGDHGGVIAAQFGVRWTLPDYLRLVQKALGADLTQFNGEDSRTLPMPARYVIADGRIAYAEVNADCTPRPEPFAVLPVLEQLGAGSWRYFGSVICTQRASGVLER